MIEGLRHPVGWIGCAITYKQISAAALRRGFSQLTIVEDDALLYDNFIADIDIARRYLTHIGDNNWDMFSGFVADIHPNTKIINASLFEGRVFLTVNMTCSTVFNIYNSKVLKHVSNWAKLNDNVFESTVDRYIETMGNIRVIMKYPYLVGHDDNLYSSLL